MAYSSWVVELLKMCLDLLRVALLLFWRSVYNLCFVLRSAWLSGSSDGEDNDARVPSPPASTTGAGSLLDTVVLAQWEDRAEQGLFRYDVTACPTKVRGNESLKLPDGFTLDVPHLYYVGVGRVSSHAFVCHIECHS